MNLQTGVKNEVTAKEDSKLKIEGFIGHDFLYGLCRPADQWILHGKNVQVPLYALEIVNEKMEVETRYEKPDLYLDDIQIGLGRIKIVQWITDSSGQYQLQGQDTIVSNEEVPDNPLKGIGWYASKDREKIYFVQLNLDEKSKSEIKSNQTNEMSFDLSEIIELHPAEQKTPILFYAYERGHLKGITPNIAEAINMAYEYMGIVTDRDGNMIWKRVNRSPYRSIENPQERALSIEQALNELDKNQSLDQNLIMDATGCTIQQMFYFINKGIPVLAYTSPDEYVLICGYDTYNVHIFDPKTNSVSKMGIQSAQEYFTTLKNEFICEISIS
jgi:hypothetical protein